ncbi:unnamed protein product [Sphagnum balticum]
MFFLRYQEHYESPNSKFRGKSFEILDFMKWYSKKYGEGAFTYPSDWGGFNVSGDIIKKVWALGISDRNLYDYEMREVYRKCFLKYPDGKFYLIGVYGKGGSLRHEIAHGFFYTIPEYKREMTKLVRNLKPSLYKSLCSHLKKIGYASSVYVDECQAYLSTGQNFLKLRGQDKPFIKLYEQYFGEVALDPSQEPLFDGEDGRLRTALVLASIASHERLSTAGAALNLYQRTLYH